MMIVPEIIITLLETMMIAPEIVIILQETMVIVPEIVMTLQETMMIVPEIVIILQETMMTSFCLHQVCGMDRGRKSVLLQSQFSDVSLGKTR